MADKVTSFSDVIVPDVFVPYMQEITAAKSELFQSGIIAPDPEIAAAMSGQGLLVQMPFWDDLSGDAEISPSDGTTAVTTDEFTTGQDQALVLSRSKAWKANRFSTLLAGSDPALALADRFGAYWAREYQKVLLQVLAGVFGAATMSGKVHDITAKSGDLAKVSGATFMDAVQVMGDAKDRITAIMMHSAVETALAKMDLIDYERDSTGSTTLRIFMGKRVIVDDSLAPASGGIYTTYLFGQGAVGWGERDHSLPVELDRESLKDNDVIINRKIFVLHPRGVKWAGTVAPGVSNTTLATGTNWERVYEEKNVRIVKFLHKI